MCVCVCAINVTLDGHLPYQIAVMMMSNEKWKKREEEVENIWLTMGTLAVNGIALILSSKSNGPKIGCTHAHIYMGNVNDVQPLDNIKNIHQLAANQ